MCPVSSEEYLARLLARDPPTPPNVPLANAELNMCPRSSPLKSTASLMRENASTLLRLDTSA